ncbi:hypothetical protein CNMCM6936_006845 [Aspergillus lentulus]|nr:hypothetical protein CNMCM6069_008746 [Aspergillus lentulus]KAF4169686.1 hypothetical protein CNMCM6936_006845 [Aspergillus lentulus]KAF4181087.1 hypothetical protein CNMCM8060_009733 [Aspergillus lentulus]KAF4187717.1 hypothetical protein CNMCM7927_003663 [Aspergillus lentulus]KAF4195994.1 hypothetical protein CNMCM8694_005588 [Aspergillus lentulus]
MESEDAQRTEQSRFSDPAESVSNSSFSKASTEQLQSEEIPSVKVAIPRLAPARTTGHRRIRTACAACREQKAKCSEHRPCLRCVSFGITCTSLESKRESRERQIEELEQQVALYEELLQHLRSRADVQDAELITRTLHGRSSITGPPSPDPVSATHPTPTHPSFAVDYVEEDYHRNQQLHAFGYLGSHSEISWIRDLRKEIDRATPLAEAKAASPGNGSKALTSVSYFLDDQNLLVDHSIAPYDRPSRTLGDRLIHLYFDAVHPSFPIVGRIPFMQQYALYYSRPNMRPPERWLAILNLIFALGAKLQRLLAEPLMEGTDGPLEYFSRAQKLNFTNGQIFDHPNLQQVQAEGLSAFWLMSMGHVNRAWRTCGVSMRSAIALGINLRSESKDTPNFSKELRYRVWWSIYTLENTLSIMTGRPTSAADTFCTTPLPIPYEEDQFHGPVASQLLSDYSVRYGYMQAFSSRRHKHPPSQVSTKPAPSVGHYLASTINEAAPSNSLYFLYFIDITMIMRRAIDVLYAPGGSREPWPEVGAAIVDLVRDADAWSNSLPDAFQFRPMQRSKPFERQRWSLAFRFYSTKITISRPSLCRTDRLRPGQVQNPPLDQRKNAKICVDSACDILDLLPDTPDVLWLVQLSPWWCIIHYLMQSATILLIELDFCVKFDVEEAAKITLMVEKAMGWLLAMAADDLAAQRAWEVCHSLYCCISLTPADSMNVTPSLSTSPEPPRSNILRAMRDGLQLPQSNVSLSQNTVVHPTLQTMYDQFVPRESSGAMFDKPGNTNDQ